MPSDDILSWGRVLRARHAVARPRWRDELPGLIKEGTDAGGKLLGIGLRRSYGDSGLNPDGVVVDMTSLDRVIAFDPETRLLRAEAGMSLDAVLWLMVPRGFFLPVTPGTRFVTLGGAVANDVHGKNHHHTGTFGGWVRRLGLLRSDGREIELGPADDTGVFAATVGGLGLTGLIAWVEIEMVPIASAMMEVETPCVTRLSTTPSPGSIASRRATRSAAAFSAARGTRLRVRSRLLRSAAGRACRSICRGSC
jgi:FAD/FMN-containing dehydrogenase